MAKTAGEEWDEFAAWVQSWNHWEKDHPRLTKDGRVKAPRKLYIDALCVVRVPKQETLVWDDWAKKRAIYKLLEEEEALAREGY